MNDEWVRAGDFRDPIVGLIGTLAHARKYTEAEEPFVKDLLDRLDSITNELVSLLPENQS